MGAVGTEWVDPNVEPLVPVLVQRMCPGHTTGGGDLSGFAKEHCVRGPRLLLRSEEGCDLSRARGALEQDG